MDVAGAVAAPFAPATQSTALRSPAVQRGRQAASVLPQRFELQTKRVYLGKWNCGPTTVILKVNEEHPYGLLEFFPAEGYGLGDARRYVNVPYDLSACTRFEVDKTNGTLCFWSMWEPPWMDLLGTDMYAPFVSHEYPKSSLFIQYDKKAFDVEDAPQWPSTFVRLPPARACHAIARASATNAPFRYAPCPLPLAALLPSHDVSTLVLRSLAHVPLVHDVTRS